MKAGYVPISGCARPRYLGWKLWQSWTTCTLNLSWSQHPGIPPQGNVLTKYMMESLEV
ncbi:hypothetical protein BDP55DRAFT_646855 [Colletotrichum godetiae]|uniref:Uncharacterized protein n=1 Tax=Colletotrichum godetiae TaxID=1209918 RepID=A0AAJ0AW04_9PEZI|nr:uncharacterized protein BDP55DRAFT_646855 [Colletotrichum godetiae]KAK1691379.1 hypothetical protein BDP55DRAFT_646855 [Colletotrichum godetiae]